MRPGDIRPGYPDIARLPDPNRFKHRPNAVVKETLCARTPAAAGGLPSARTRSNRKGRRHRVRAQISCPALDPIANALLLLILVPPERTNLWNGGAGIPLSYWVGSGIASSDLVGLSVLAILAAALHQSRR